MKTVDEDLTHAPEELPSWHSHLHKVIVTGQCGPGEAMRTGSCAFGKWLKELEDSGHQNARAAELHRHFHSAAAHILEIAQSGSKLEALALLSAEGEYAGIYSELMLEMEGWKKQQFPWYVPRRL